MRTWLFLLGLIPSGILFAQNEIDALRYTQLQYYGTARYNGMSGAFGALGADISVASTNPAGLAKFNKSEFSFSPGISIYGTHADYNGTSQSDSDLRGNMNQFGFVAVNRMEADNFNQWKSVQFAINYTKLATFNYSTSISGLNNNSLLAVFAQQAAGTDANDLSSVSPFGSGVAYQAYAIDPIGATTDYTHRFVHVDSIQQNLTLSRKGGMNETAFSLSGNYGDKLLIGATVGIPSVRFREEYIHREARYNPSGTNHIDTLENFSYAYNLTTRGTGINLKVGVIIIPTNFIRIGFAAHTPSRILLTDNWNSSMQTQFADGGTETGDSPDGRYQYRLTTPARLMGSIAGIIKKRGVVSAEVEYLDYGNSKFASARRSASFNYSNINNTIDDLYRSAITGRVGGEFRIDQLLLRAGFMYQMSPYDETLEDVVESNPQRTSYSLGFGYRTKTFFADMALSFTNWSEDYYLYDPVLVNAAILKNSETNISFSIGFRY